MLNKIKYSVVITTSYIFAIAILAYILKSIWNLLAISVVFMLDMNYTSAVLIVLLVTAFRSIYNIKDVEQE